MVTYVAFVAITNFVLGFLVSRALLKAQSMDARLQREPSPENNGMSEIVHTHSPSNHTSDETSTLTDDLQQTLAGLETLTNDFKKEQKARPATVELASWDDFAQQLREIKNRAQYCKSAGDKKLAQQAANQLRTCAQTWYRQVDKFLSGGDLDEASLALMNGVDATAMEMLAAQCETSISNIDAIDYTATIDDVLAALDREVLLLDGEQQNVARCLNAAAEAART